MKEAMAKAKKIFLSDWTPLVKGLLLLDVLLFGILLGWLTSPFADGFSLFSNNSFNCDNSFGDAEFEEDEEE